MDELRQWFESVDWKTVVTVVYLAIEYLLKIIAVGTVPENRKPSSSSAWLLLILFLPLVGFPLYWMIGSPYVTGRRHDIQKQINSLLTEYSQGMPLIPEAAEEAAGDRLRGILTMNHELTGLPAVTGEADAIYDDTAEFFAALAASIDEAQEFVHIAVYITTWDDATDVVFTALERAVARGVRVCFLMDHWGSRRYGNWRGFRRRLTEAGIEWHLMMPLNPLRGRWRRPDLRNHRKVFIVDDTVAYMGSHNLIETAYGSTRNRSVGRHWKDVSVRLSGEVVREIETVFATDWYIETGEVIASPIDESEVDSVVEGADFSTMTDEERLAELERLIDSQRLVELGRERAQEAPATLGGHRHAFQIIPSGPGFPSEPNMRMFVELISGATKTLRITSPYFVPNEALLTAITSASMRGVRVDLFVSEKADQFIVGHAQRSFYNQLLRAGVHIHLYEAPRVLHSKHITADGVVGVIGSSNLDYRSFALDYEITLLGFGGELVDMIDACEDRYRPLTRELTAEEWAREKWYRRYVDNVCRLAAALM
ncbi:phospholipase D-like domain-containing protein [Brachybacterium huguangmaarense]